MAPGSKQAGRSSLPAGYAGDDGDRDGRRGSRRSSWPNRRRCRRTEGRIPRGDVEEGEELVVTAPGGGCRKTEGGSASSPLARSVTLPHAHAGQQQEEEAIDHGRDTPALEKDEDSPDARPLAAPGTLSSRRRICSRRNRDDDEAVSVLHRRGCGRRR